MDDSTVEALREVLQDMTSAIEVLSSGERSGEALINFIEEMLKTIEAWAAKYNVILDEGVVAMESAQIPRPNSDLGNNPNYPLTNPSEVKDHPEPSVDSHLVNQRKEHGQTEGELQRHSTQSLDQDGDGNKEKGEEHLTQSQNDENEGVERQVAGKSRPKPVRKVSRKTRSQVALASTASGPVQVDGTSVDDGEAKVNSLGLPVGSPKPTDATSPSQRKGDLIMSPDWLPQGWITGASAGSKYKYYFDPISKQQFRSKKEVLAFLGTTKRKRGRPKKLESLAGLAQTTEESPRYRFDAAEAESIQESAMSENSELQAPSNTSSFNHMTPSTSLVATCTEAINSSMPSTDSTKRKRGRPRKVDSVKNLSQTKDQSPGNANAAAQSGTVHELVNNSTSELQVPFNRCSNTAVMPPPVVASASSEPMNSCIPIPHQSGQSSEWLVYESLASLPFPMFEHLRLVESNANKLANNNSSSTLWPWMLGSEGLKKPFMDTKPDENRPVDESKQDRDVSISSTGETQAAEVVPKRPKKAARKNAS